MKRFLNIALMATMICGLSLAVTSCKDDDNNKSSDVNAPEGATEEDVKAQAELKATGDFWQVVGQLAGTECYTSNWRNQKFEPIIGIPSDNNPAIRLVITDGIDNAAQSFGYLIDQDITAATDNYVYENEAVGKLEYNKTNDGKSLAKVNVQIPQMPNLQQIVYLTTEQMGENATQKFAAYYRFGDVVSKTVANGQKEYWVCVRPAFCYEGKKESHWISLSPLPADKVWSYKASTGTQYNLPGSGIGTDKNHMQNFAEMIYAILYPDIWWENLEKNKKPVMFTDFSRGYKDYHNRYFWQNVARSWKDKGVFQKVFGQYFTLENFKTEIEKNGLNLLYKGVCYNDWWKSVSWNLILHEAKYQFQTDDNVDYKLRNAHDAHYNDVKKDVKNIKDLDVTKLSVEKPYLESEFFNKVPHFIIRHATGSELSGQNLNTVEGACKALGNQVEDEYVYNTSRLGRVGVGEEPEISKDIASIPVLGHLLGKNGKFYENMNALKTAGTEALCVVVYISPIDESTGKHKPVEEGTNFYGIAMGLENTNITENHWYTEVDNEPVYCTETASEKYANVKDQLNGLALTNQYKKGCGKGHQHPFITALQMYTEKFEPKTDSYEYLSEWMVPSVGQMTLAFEGMGLKASQKGDYCVLLGKDGEEESAYRTLEEFIGNKANLFILGENNSCSYWTTTEYDKELAWTIDIEKDKISFGNYDKSTTLTAQVRPFILFGNLEKADD